MKPPVPLNPTIVALIAALCVAGALLPVGGPPGEIAEPPAAEPGAAAGETPPDAGWREPDYLLHYAKVVCVRAAYGSLEPAPSQVLEALDMEAWAMVELSHQQPDTYHAIHKAAWAAGGGQVPTRAIAGCDAWAKAATGGLLERAATFN